MFKSQSVAVSLWQTLADNFYPERADFLLTRNMTGLEMANNTVDSFPILARRDLGNSFHAMLRDARWFEITAGADTEADREGKLWLEWATNRQYKIMQDRSSNFERAVKIGDHDFATFGNAVLSLEPNKTRTGVIYRPWHLRDCAWEENESGQVETVVRKWDPTLHQLVRIFGEKALTPALREKYNKNPFCTTRVYHMTIPSDLSGDEEMTRYKNCSYFVLESEKTMLEYKGINYAYYIVPRFQTIAGSPYGYSPATMAALPDARTLQSMTFTLLEAGERYARPPMVATSKVITGVVDLSPNGITWVDNEYDERLGQALRSLDQNKGGYPIGAAERNRVYETLQKSFYLDTLSLPLGDKEMTAYEVQERMKQYRRTNLPLFAPMERDYNGQICEATFDLMLMMGQLGSPQDIPKSLGTDVEFKYVSPLTSDEEEEKMNQFARIRQELAEAAQLDAGVLDNFDFDEAIRDSIQGVDAPVNWTRPYDEVTQVREARLAQQAAAAAAEMGAPQQGAA